MDTERLERLTGRLEMLTDLIDETETAIRLLSDSCPLCQNSHYPHCVPCKPEGVCELCQNPIDGIWSHNDGGSGICIPF